MAAGADLAAVDLSGRTPLALAESRHKGEVASALRFLAKRGGKPGGWGWTGVVL